MPRFLPKLIRRIKASKDGHAPKMPINTSPPSRSKKHVFPKAFQPPSFSPHGRKQSILLDDVNPIIHRDAFIRHKLDSPIPPSAAGRGKDANTSRQLREMTKRECALWSDPYLRMLASPLRQCLVTQKHLPTDFMIRLAVLRLGPRFSQPVAALLPDGVEHPRFRRRNSGRGHYLTCHKILVDEMVSRSSHKRIPGSNCRVHSLLAAQIGHQLRLRVLQELELLSESLRCVPQGSQENTILRRVTRAEWVEMKTSGRIPQPGAVALVVVPPLNHNKTSGRRVDNGDELPLRPAANLPPLSVLHGTRAPCCSLGSESLLSTPQVPLYNGLALFPCRAMRSKLYRSFQKALLVERRARWRQGALSRGAEQPLGESGVELAKDKASHAYLLRSDENTVGRADSVPLAIALWRVRMWEGQGWEDDLGNH